MGAESGFCMAGAWCAPLRRYFTVLHAVLLYFTLPTRPQQRQLFDLVEHGSVRPRPTLTTVHVTSQNSSCDRKKPASTCNGGEGRGQWGA